MWTEFISGGERVSFFLFFLSKFRTRVQISRLLFYGLFYGGYFFFLNKLFMEMEIEKRNTFAGC